MSSRALVVLALLAAAAVAFVIWIDRPPGKPADTGGGLGALLPVKVDDVRAVEVQRGVVDLRLERAGDAGWRLTRPLEAEADSRQVDALLKSLAEGKLLRAVDDKGAGAAGFGLSPPEATVSVDVRGGGRSKVLTLGRLSPVGPEHYVSVGDGRILLASVEASAVLDRSPDDFREKRLVPVDADDVTRIELARPARRLVLARDGNAWRLVEPVSDLADFAAADGLARDVTGLKLSHLADPLATASSFGDAAPWARVVVEARNPARRFVADIGEETKGGERQARREGSSIAGTIAVADLGGLGRETDEFRDKRPGTFSTPDVREIRISQAGVDLRVRREREGSAWSVQAGRSDSPAEGPKVDAFLDRLRWLRARSFGAPLPQGWKPACTLEILGDDGKALGRLELGDLPPAAPEGKPAPTVPVRSSWRPGWVFEVPIDQIGEIPKKPSDLAAPPGPGPGGSPKP